MKPNHLPLAAIAKLTFIDGMATVTRADILREMQSATGFYNENHRKNLSKSLRTLARQKKSLNDPRMNTHCPLRQ